MANTTILTANEIITQALSQVGNPAITTEAAVYLNNFLSRLYADLRWPFLRVSVSGTVTEGEFDTALPADFIDIWNKDSVRITDPGSSNSDYPIEVITQQEYENLTYQGLNGPPKKIVFDYAAQTFTFYPRPNKSLTYSLTYRKKFTPIVDFDAVVAFPNDDLLVQAIFAWALKWEDDDRYPAAIQELQGMLRQFIKSYNMSPSKISHLALQTNTFKSMTFIR